MAKSAKAQITPDILHWARERIKISPSFAAEKIGVTEEVLASWECGDDYPTIKQLESIVKVYKCHFSIFYLPSPPTDFKPLKDYRKPNYTSGDIQIEVEEYKLHANIIETYQRREALVALYELLDQKPDLFTLRATIHEPCSVVADRIRSFLAIDMAELRSLGNNKYEIIKFWKRLIENKDILVCQTSVNTHLAISPKIMQGFCISERPFPVIVVNSSEPNVYRKLFTIIHELVHIALGTSAIQNIDFREIDTSKFDPVEVFCNQVAAEILVPSSLLRSLIPVNHGHEWNSDELLDLANNFKVNNEVVLRRLLSLGYTTQSFYQRYRREQSGKWNSRPQPKGFCPDYSKRIINSCGEYFVKTTFQAYYENKITSYDLSEYLTGCNLKHIADIEHAIFAR